MRLIPFIFGRCHRSLAIMKPAMYEYDISLENDLCNYENPRELSNGG